MILISGDMATTLGSSGNAESPTFLRVPIDLLDVSVRNSGRITEYRALSHCIIRRRWTGGGYFRGGITAVCNAQFVKGRNLAPKGHPNDGRFEVVEVSARTSVRQRFLILSRLSTGTHVPHPDIRIRQMSAYSDAESSGAVLIDGVSIPGVIDTIRVIPDAIVIWIPLPIIETGSACATNLETHEE